MAHGLRLAIVVGLMGMLAGCWLSAQPLIGTENASSVPFQGPFKPDKENVVVEARANADGSHSLIDNNGNGFDAFYFKVRDDWYVGQIDLKVLASDGGSGDAGPAGVRQATGETGFLYNLMRIRGRDLLFYMPGCDEATASITGVKRELPVEGLDASCAIGSLSALQQAAQEHIGRIESGQIKDEPKFLRATDRAPR